MVLACHAFDNEMSTEVDATQGATTEEHHGDAARFVGKRELEASQPDRPMVAPEAL